MASAYLRPTYVTAMTTVATTVTNSTAVRDCYFHNNLFLTIPGVIWKSKLIIADTDDIES